MYQYRLLVMVSVADNSMDDYFNHWTEGIWQTDALKFIPDIGLTV